MTWRTFSTRISRVSILAISLCGWQTAAGAQPASGNATADPRAPASPQATQAPPAVQRDSNDPDEISGLERPERQSGDLARDIGSVALFIPRATVELFFITTGVAAGLVEEQQVVPRVKDLLSPPPGEIRVFPTLFAETGSGFNIGVRAIGRARQLASTVRAGIGGPHDLVAESRLRWTTPAPRPLALSLEVLHDERSTLGFSGIGQDPESDSRNSYLPGSTTRTGSYREQRERFIAGAGLRPFGDVELLSSTSYARRRLLQPSDGEALSDVFAPASIVGDATVTQVVYSEFALRLDTRATRGTPATGVLIEGYGGGALGRVGKADFRYLRSGGTAAAFLSIVESSNILSPAVTMDGLSPRSGPLPFLEYPRQPQFRGFDNRRDFVSLVASLDYRWTLMRYLAARLFTDAATVAPRVAELDLGKLRTAAGFGFDVFSRSSQLGSVAASFSGDGFRFLLTFGVRSGFGDRQHRS